MFQSFIKKKNSGKYRQGKKEKQHKQLNELVLSGKEQTNKKRKLRGETCTPPVVYAINPESLQTHVCFFNGHIQSIGKFSQLYLQIIFSTHSLLLIYTATTKSKVLSSFSQDTSCLVTGPPTSTLVNHLCTHSESS